MQAATTVGLDILNSVFFVFEVRRINAQGYVLLGQRLRRCRVLSFFKKQPHGQIGIESCATAPYWLGHAPSSAASPSLVQAVVLLVKQPCDSVLR